MTQPDYLTQLISSILALIKTTSQKKTVLSQHHYKRLLNEIYLKYFGCDRRAVKIFKTDYFLENCCTEENFHPQKGLLLIWLYLEEVTLSSSKSEQTRLRQSAGRLYHALLPLLPESVATLIQQALGDDMPPRRNGEETVERELE